MSVLQARTSNGSSSNQQMIGALRRSLDQKYSEVLRAAQNRWERSFACADPSDACVSVRISGHSLAATRRRFTRAIGYGL
jgi:hypothetical protein